MTSLRRWCHYIYVQALTFLDDVLTFRDSLRSERRGTEARALRAVEDKDRVSARTNPDQGAS